MILLVNTTSTTAPRRFLYVIYSPNYAYVMMSNIEISQIDEIYIGSITTGWIISHGYLNTE